MSAAVHSLQVYEDLAEWYDRQGQAKLRDWFLMLAADTALAMGEKVRAEHFRKRILHVNPHHMLRPFATFSEALKTPDVRRFVADLRRRYPLEAAEHLLKASLKQRGQAKDTQEPEIKVLKNQKHLETTTRAPTVVPPKSAALGKSDSKRSVTTPKFQLAVTWKRPIRDNAPQPMDSLDKAQSHATQEEVVEKDSLSAWISTGLIIVTVLTGLGVALYTLASPIFTG